MGEQEPGVRIRRLSSVPDHPQFKSGLFVQPVIFTGIDNDHRVAREEIFGPVTCVIPFKNYEDVIERSEKHTSELQSLMRISYAVFCLKKKIKQNRLT